MYIYIFTHVRVKIQYVLEPLETLLNSSVISVDNNLRVISKPKLSFYGYSKTLFLTHSISKF